ncbi:glycosyltransferase family 2 protein [Microbacterium candidum]|uniref:glycosyltransferase family 2 protein n=1 Tax=Microbacterium candidum TaxID=3041922 RepID=UPI003B029FA8
MTSFNHQAYAEQCLASIASQTSAAEQVVIVDDHSTDESAAVISAWLDRYDPGFEFIPRTVNGGVCTALDDALSIARGRFLCHISADDWMEPERLERQSTALANASDDVAFVVSDIHEVDAGGITLAYHDIGARLLGLTGSHHRERLHRTLLQANILPAPGILMRTAAVVSVGGYDESLSFEDYDMWLRLTQRYSAEYAPGVVTNYRVLATSLTRSPARQMAFLATERACLLKQLGGSEDDDRIIRARTDELAEQLALIQESSALASNSRGIDESASATSVT